MSVASQEGLEGGELDPLFHRDLVESVPIVGGRIACYLTAEAERLAGASGIPEPGITVAVRTKNEAAALQDLCEDLEQQDFTGPVELVVVDDNSVDGTDKVAKRHNAVVRKIERNRFTYPRSMNLAMEAASYDTVFLTVGHVRLVSNGLLRAASQRLAEDGVAGAYSRILPNDNASTIEKLVAMGMTPHFSRARKVKRVGLGVMAARNAAISKQVWSELGGFDERYETGGEDMILARGMLDAGYSIIEDPALSVHHSHGDKPLEHVLAALNFLRIRYIGPQAIDREALPSRKPHLDFGNLPDLSIEPLADQEQLA